jgi:uncharacterized protein
MICNRAGRWHLLLVNAVLWCAFAVSAQSLEVPFLAGRVNDTANMLSSKTINALEALLKAHEDSTSNQVVVLTISSLQGEALEEYSIKVVDTWKLGRKDKDNGVLLLIARDDRKVRIEVGNGLEGDLPDITCGHIIRNEIVPRFRNSDYEGGIRAGVSAILGAINGSYKAEESSAMVSPDFLFFGIFLIVVGLFTTIAVFLQGAISWILYAFLIPFWAAFPMVSLGVKIGAILLAIYLVGFPIIKLWFAKTKKGQALAKKWSVGAPTEGTNLRDGRASRSRRDSSSGSSGWSFGGGSSGGFSSGGSSFSGDGGSFSGGGASGSW